MKSIGLYLLLVAAIQFACFAEVTKFPREHRKVLEDSSRFRKVLVTSNLPPAITALCTDGKGKLAEPGQKWEATDVISDATLPRKRLIWAAVSGSYYVVHYERGGFAHSNHVLVATLAKGDSKPKVLWRGVGGKFKDYAAFLDAFRSGKLDDTLDDAH